VNCSESLLDRTRGRRYNDSKFKLYLKTHNFAIFHRILNKLSSDVTAMQATVSDREKATNK
jgi:hypothetical protein